VKVHWYISIPAKKNQEKNSKMQKKIGISHKNLPADHFARQFAAKNLYHPKLVGNNS